MQTKRFRNIFKTQFVVENSPTSQTNGDLSDENISEFSSGSDWNASEQENQESPIRISGYSSDDNENNNNVSSVSRNSYMLNNSYHTTSANKRRRRPPRKPLTKLKVSRQPKRLFTNTESKRVLTPLNSPAKEQRVFKSKESPWDKVKNLFQALENTPPRRSASSNDYRRGNEMMTNSPDDIAEQTIEWTSSSSASETSCDATQMCSQVISTPSTSSQGSQNPPTELDLLLALIERENTKEKRKSHIKAKASKKRFRKDGYLQALLRTLEAAKTDKKYLEHDKKFGLQSGTQFEVVSLETSFGVRFAIGQLFAVDSEESRQLVRIVLDAELAKQVRVGSKLEVFFNASEAFTSSGRDGVEMPTYVQPHKLLLL